MASRDICVVHSSRVRPWVRRATGLLLFFVAMCPWPAPGQTSSTAQPGNTQVRPLQRRPAEAASPPQDVDILSDTQGVDFKPYLHGVLKTIYTNWVGFLPEEARPPQRVAGRTVIRFTIGRDGTLLAMHLDGSTHNDRLNRAAWGAITAVHDFPALPDAFHGPNLELRVHFRVNDDTSGITSVTAP